MKKNISTTWSSNARKNIVKNLIIMKLTQKTRKRKANIRMLNVRYAQMGTIQMTIWLSFAVCATSVFINAVSDLPKYQLKVGSVKSAWLLDQQASIYRAHSATSKEAQWKGLQFISIAIYLSRQTLAIMNTRKSVLTANKKRSTSPSKKSKDRKNNQLVNPL